MSILISANQIKKGFGARALFDSITFVIESEDRVGLIGPNGAGKSTLLKILAGEETPDAGELSIQRGLRIGYLEQTPVLNPEATVVEGIHSTDDSLGEILSKLELTPLEHVKIGTLSGGWKKRVALAKELTKRPDLLLLDEPTNHLDIESILWLEQFLKKSPIATLTITHDRLFLQRTCSRILELDRKNPGGLLNIRGDYSTYLDQKAALLENQQLRETKLRNTLRRETEWLRQGAKARTTKQQARIHAAATLKSEVEELQYRNQNQSARIEFQASDRKPKRLLEAKKITKKVGDKTLFRDLDLFLGPGTRMGLLGRNGCGKSTLIRILLGEELPDSGQILKADPLKVAYFEQNRDRLHPEVTLRKTLCPDGDHVNYRGKLEHINGYLDRFLFRKEQIDMKVGALSGGEQSRVLIGQLMLKEASLLILDEPTNDLDVETLNVLEECLTEFDGAVLLVTHDRYFLDQVTDEIIAFPSDGAELIHFAGLAQWENWKKENRPSKSTPTAESKNQSETKKKKMGYLETRELSQIGGKIEAAETRLKTLEQEIALPQNQSNASHLAELCQSLENTQKEIEKLYARWAELEESK